MQVKAVIVQSPLKSAESNPNKAQAVEASSLEADCVTYMPGVYIVYGENVKGCAFTDEQPEWKSLHEWRIEMCVRLKKRVCEVK